MKSAADIETAIAARCAILGLTQPQAQALADAEPFPSDLANVLALDCDTLAPLPTERWLWMAAQTSSASYSGALTPDALLATLVSGDVPDGIQAHMMHFLDEAPMQLVIMASEQAVQQSGMPMAHVWDSIARLNRALKGRRLSALHENTQVQCLLDNRRHRRRAGC